MQLLKSYNEYKDMIREFREKCRRPFSNVYYVPDDMERYIQLGRVSYEKDENGIVLYFDEGTYKRVCLCVNEKGKFSIDCSNKKILIKNVFQEGKKRENLLCVEQRLEELGFKREGTSVKIQGDVSKLLQRCERIKKYVYALEKKGYRSIVPDISMLDEIDAMILNSGKIKDYQLNYWTDEEKKKMINDGDYLCIVNNDNQLCAVGFCIIEDDITKGVAVVVKEEYKMHGLTPALSYYRFSQLYDKGVKRVQGWILDSNEPSLKYHRNMGYEFTNEYTDEWVLE